MKILIVIDQYGWSYDSLARGLQKYSKNDITIKKLDDVTLKDMQNTNLIFVFSWINLATLQENREFYKVMKNKKIVTGSWSAIVPTENSYRKYTGRQKPPDLSVVDTLIVSDRRVWKALIRNNVLPNVNVFFADQAVDTEIFSPDLLKVKSEFKVGWCGNPTRPDKRTHILDKLNRPVEKRALWGTEYFVKNRSLTELNDWYNSLDVYVSVSNPTVEGGTSLTVVEAMACGLPVISTAHGSEIPRLLDDLMIIPVAETETVKKTNEILDVLERDPELRKSIGERNRRVVEERYSWKVLAKHYDEIFSQFGFRYVRFNDVSQRLKNEFFRRVKERFVNDPEDNTLYLNGDWRIAPDGSIYFPLEYTRYGYACINRVGEMVGYWAIMWLPPTFGYGDKTVFPSTMVECDYRGMGIGKHLYELVEFLAIGIGAEKYFAGNKHNDDGKPINVTPHIYAKRGFKLVDQYTITSTPRGLELKYKPEWDNKQFTQRIFIKELKDE